METSMYCSVQRRFVIAILTASLAAMGCDGGSSGDPDAATVDAPTVNVDAPGVDAGIDATPSTAVELDFHLGHVWGITRLARSGRRAISLDQRGHWVLWNLDTQAALARGDAACSELFECPSPLVSIAGTTMLVRTPAGLDVRDAMTGNLLSSTATNPGFFGIAVDGSYVWSASASGLVVVPRVGGAWTRAGNYLFARVFAAAADLRVANGPAGAGVIEVIRASDQNASTFPFAGNFHSWFLDGGRFLTTVGMTVRVYSNAGVSEALATLPDIQNLTGQGNYVWTVRPDFGNNFKIGFFARSGDGIGGVIAAAA